MDEGEYQTNVIWAIRQLCEEKNGSEYRTANLSIVPTKIQDQSLLNEAGNPYDVGIVLEKAFFIGLEIKATVVDNAGAISLKSWNSTQFKQYVDLTEAGYLPLYYAYNVEYLGGEVSNQSEVLKGSRISRPKLLPGKTPTSSAHQRLDEWMNAWFDDPAGQGATRFDHVLTDDVPLIYDIIEQGHPDLAWLVVLSSPKLTLRSIIPNDELFNIVREAKQTWGTEKASLGHLPKSARVSPLLASMQAYLEQMVRDVAQQVSNATDMADKPASEVEQSHDSWRP
ncbi:hypothetical protein [Ralstonia pseudosolanacearum]|uniref:hypothetical protein n=1 Tax=Ralstonia pseudosolanacearum TaxID=1310165 RepID=UPI0018D0880C|nr:hypothetical protein [Ralstonia pseudosolanacearum]